MATNKHLKDENIPFCEFLIIFFNKASSVTKEAISVLNIDYTFGQFVILTWCRLVISSE